MELSSSQIIVASIAVVALWRALRSFASRGSLSHIPGPHRPSWWKGNFDRFFNAEGWKFHEELYRKYGGAVRLDMMFGDQQLYVSDPLALHHICVKEQYIYEESETFLTMNRLTLGPSLLSTLGEDHKRQRKMLNPVFSPKHMRDFNPVFYPIAHKLCVVLENEVPKDKQHIDVMNWISRAILEYIGQGVLGYSFDTLDERQTNAFSEAIKAFGPLLDKFNFLLQFLPQAVKLGSPSFRRKVMEMIPLRSVRSLVTIIDTIENHSKEILQGKRQALQNGDEATHAQIGSGKDAMSVLMTANLSANGVTSLPESELLAHMSTFILTGHDTTTLAVSRILHILSENQEAQSKLRDEVTAARKEHGDLDYDMLMALPYLDAVCRETMRVYPPLPHIGRTTRKDTVLPLLWPVKSIDGKSEIKEIHIKKNTTVHISILGANRSKAILGEDADEWKPERWLEPLSKSVDDAHLPGVYSKMMTFLGGGRACIGLKFAEAEMKLSLSMLLEKFVFEPGPEIYWAMGTLYHPIVKDEGGYKAQVPLKVSIVGK